MSTVSRVEQVLRMLFQKGKPVTNACKAREYLNSTASLIRAGVTRHRTTQYPRSQPKGVPGTTWLPNCTSVWCTLAHRSSKSAVVSMHVVHYWWLVRQAEKSQHLLFTNSKLSFQKTTRSSLHPSSALCWSEFRVSIWEVC